MSSQPDKDKHYQEDTLRSPQATEPSDQNADVESGVQAVKAVASPPAQSRTQPLGSVEDGEANAASHPTMIFFEGRERQGAVTHSVTPKKRRGLFPADELINPGGPALSGLTPQRTLVIPTSEPSSIKPSSRPSAPPTSAVMRLAQEAYQRTLDFLTWLLAHTPDDKRADLEKAIQEMPGAPRNLPREQVVKRFEWLGHSIGYHGPVLWFIPPHISLGHLLDAGVLDPLWWFDEPNFIKGHQTICPYDLDDLDSKQEPGYWILALPGIMPGTANRTYAEQSGMLEVVARTAGLKTRDGRILYEEDMRVMVRGVAEVTVFFALAQFVKARLTDTPVSVRTSSCHRSYRSDAEKPQSSKLLASDLGPPESLYDKCQVCVSLVPDGKLQIHDMGDKACGMTLGLTTFFVPFIY